MRRLLAPIVLALAACAGLPARSPAPEAPRAPAASLAAGTEGGFETGRLTGAEEGVRGPFLLAWLSPGAELELVSTADGAALGRVTGPLPGPLHLGPGTLVRLPAPGEALYAGVRPMPMTRALDAWVGRQIAVVLPGAQPERWTLRQIGGDHVVVERSRTYRVLPVRRIAEITWTDLTGIDPAPRLVLAPE